jgi:hypothetical protein
MKRSAIVLLALTLHGAACSHEPSDMLGPAGPAAPMPVAMPPATPPPPPAMPPEPPAMPPEPAATPPGTPPTTADCMPSTHPGTITRVDEETGTVTVLTLDMVPMSLWWRNTPGGRVPVIRMVRSKLSSGQIEIKLYGPCDRLLETVLSR